LSHLASVDPSCAISSFIGGIVMMAGWRSSARPGNRGGNIMLLAMGSRGGATMLS